MPAAARAAEVEAAGRMRVRDLILKSRINLILPPLGVKGFGTILQSPLVLSNDHGAGHNSPRVRDCLDGPVS